MIIERLENGYRVFVCTSRSGRKYTGATPEEAERKKLLAILHAADREFGNGASGHMIDKDGDLKTVHDNNSHSAVRDLCDSMFGTLSFGRLSVKELRELKAMVDESRRAGRKLDAGQSLEPKLTDKQRKRIIRLGLYVLGPVYGQEWFWAKCKKWIVRLHDAERVDLDQLTNQEAWYLIRRLEKIEARLLKTGEVMTEAQLERLGDREAR